MPLIQAIHCFSSPVLGKVLLWDEDGGLGFCIEGFGTSGVVVPRVTSVEVDVDGMLASSVDVVIVVLDFSVTISVTA